MLTDAEYEAILEDALMPTEREGYVWDDLLEKIADYGTAQLEEGGAALAALRTQLKEEKMQRESAMLLLDSKLPLIDRVKELLKVEEENTQLQEQNKELHRIHLSTEWHALEERCAKAESRLEAAKKLDLEKIFYSVPDPLYDLARAEKNGLSIGFNAAFTICPLCNCAHFENFGPRESNLTKLRFDNLKKALEAALAGGAGE